MASLSTSFTYSILFITLCLSLHFTPIKPERCNPDDKKALLDIKQTLGSPPIISTWDPSTDCCKWNPSQVKCDPSTNRTIKLVLSNTTVAGSISPAIGDLISLQYLDLNRLANLTGGIPSSICNLVSLTLLRLKANGLTGEIPTCLSQLQSLTSLDLSYNQLSGLLPSTLSDFKSLTAIHLERNSLSGSIPDSFGNFQGVVPELYLAGNDLSGAVPTSMEAVNFPKIDLSRNNLEGNATVLFGASKSTTYLDISRNGNISFDFTNVGLGVNLQTLDINHNRIYGGIPPSIVNLANLQVFNASFNRLCGQVPQGGNMQKFDASAYQHNKCLCGPPVNASC